MMYVAQNAPRIARALFEIVLRRKWAGAAFTLLEICKVGVLRGWSCTGLVPPPPRTLVTSTWFLQYASTKSSASFAHVLISHIVAGPGAAAVAAPAPAAPV